MPGSDRMNEWPSQELHPDAYRQLVEGAPAILYIDRPDELSTNLYTSPQIVELLGYSVREWMEDAELWVRSIHPDDRERVVREHRTTNARAERFLAEYRILSKAGREVWIRDEAVPVRADDGSVVYWRGVMVDITAQKHAEEQLRSSLEEVRRMVAQRRELAQLIETAQEEERRRIAADIHDDPIQVMSAVDMRLQLLLARPDRIDAHEIGELAEELRSAIDRLRNLLFELRPVTLDLEGLTPAIAMYLEHAAKEAGWSWEVIDELDDEPGDDARVSFYRIAQEAVTNVRKHANATHVDVRLTSLDAGLLLRIADDGDGFERPEKAQPGHLGLATVTERAELAGGWCEVRSTPGEGTVLECWMPLAAPADGP
jgi:PAS domain S-box-containing protein